MWRRIRALMNKELLAMWQDRKSRILLIVPPILQLFIFTFAATLDVKNISIGVLNRDNGAQSFELVQRLIGSPFFSQVIPLKGEPDLIESINTQKILLALNFEETFSRNLLSGMPANVQLIIDGRKSNSGQIAQGYVNRIIKQYNEDFSEFLNFPPPLIRIIVRNWFNPNLIYPWFTLTGIVGILTMLTSLSVTGLSIARERELGTFDQLLITPLSSTEILLGKSIPAILVGMSEGSLMLFAGVIVVQLPLVGSLLALYAGMFVFVVSIVGVGMLISSISRTQQQATLGMFLFMVPSVILSGYATPIDNMPEWLQKISVINPLKYFIVISRGICMKGIPWSDVWRNIYPMILIGSVNMLTCVYFFRSRVTR
ncbi:MAG: ABC transporter permease [Chlamydiales bacterium]